MAAQSSRRRRKAEDRNVPWSGRLDMSPLDFFPDRRRGRIVGLSFPANNLRLGLEPSILTVLPDGDNVEYSPNNVDFNDDDVWYYLCSVYIAGLEEFKAWAARRRDRSKIVVGGYHPTMFPEDFYPWSGRIVQGPCDDIFATLAQPGQVVQGITRYNRMPRYDLYDMAQNQQIIPDKQPEDVCTSINTSMGSPHRCDFCCTPVMCPRLVSKPLELVERESAYLATKSPKFIFVRDENFLMQRDWKERLRLIKQIGAKIYLFASADTLTREEWVKVLAENGVYMVCLGLEDVTRDYSKNRHLEDAVKLLKKYGIYTYLSFIVNPLKVIGRAAGKKYYDKLTAAFETLAPEMTCGNFLMPFRGTKMWDLYYAYVSEADYKHYDSKTPFLVRNEILRQKMAFFMFWYQWRYYTSAFYQQNVRRFDVGDTLHRRFLELEKEFRTKFGAIWNVRC